MRRSLSTQGNKNVGASEGFTLVELLLVIAIMGVLTTMALAFMRSANEQARVSATQSRINRIEAILNAELERYEVRRLPISYGELKVFVEEHPYLFDSNGVHQVVAQIRSLRQRIIQELIDSEMPRPFWKDVNSSGEYVYERNRNLGISPAQHRPDYDDAAAGGFTSYRLPFAEWVKQRYPNPNPNTGMDLNETLTSRTSASVRSWGNIPVSPDPLIQLDLPGEYLYQILLRTDMDGIPAVETLGSSTIGDTDGPDGLGDGFPEILDAWGEPMHFLILQIDASEANEHQEQWTEAVDTIDWSTINTANSTPQERLVYGLPVGTKRLNPVIPRDLQKIRLKVFSRRMGINNNFAPFYTVNGS